MQFLKRLVPPHSMIAVALACAIAAASLSTVASGKTDDTTKEAVTSKAAGSGGPSGNTETLHLYEKTRSLQLTESDGRVIKHLPIPEPEPGDVLDGTFDIFKGDHEKHGRKPIGGDHLRCEFVAEGPPKCVSNAVLGSSMLVVEGFPGRITLGTGKYFGASGRVLSSTEVAEAPESQLAHNDIDVVVRIKRR
jgi:hypothetical protein